MLDRPYTSKELENEGLLDGLTPDQAQRHLNRIHKGAMDAMQASSEAGQSYREIGGIELLQLARQEIDRLQQLVAVMETTCDAYDRLTQLMDMLDRRPMHGDKAGYGNNISQIIDQKIKEMAEATHG